MFKQIQQLIKKMFRKKREHERFHVGSGTFVLITPVSGITWKVNLIDISMGGLAFVYDGTPEDLKEEGLLKLYENTNTDDKLIESDSNKYDRINKRYILDSKPKDNTIKYRTVSDTETGCGVRRRSIEFIWMGQPSIDDVKKFIKENGIMAVEK